MATEATRRATKQGNRSRSDAMVFAICFENDRGNDKRQFNPGVVIVFFIFIFFVKSEFRRNGCSFGQDGRVTLER